MCPDHNTCPESKFNCSNGRCVPYVWRCDDEDDCGDGSDEPENCHNVTCRDGHFKCNKTGKCIPLVSLLTLECITSYITPLSRLNRK